MWEIQTTAALGLFFVGQLACQGCKVELFSSNRDQSRKQYLVNITAACQHRLHTAVEAGETGFPHLWQLIVYRQQLAVSIGSLMSITKSEYTVLSLSTYVAIKQQCYHFASWIGSCCTVTGPSVSGAQCVLQVSNDTAVHNTATLWHLMGQGRENHSQV